tara:strand:- start:3338 stop:6745 length:3408 start_codon:yes stop_codon:yes gene_type:complete
MSLSLLEKLKQKPVPQKEQEFKILLSKPLTKSFTPVELKTKILDKTDQDLIDRQQFLKTLNLKIKNKEITKESESQIGKLADKIISNDKSDTELNNYIKNISKKPLRKIVLIQDLEQLRLNKSLKENDVDDKEYLGDGKENALDDEVIKLKIDKTTKLSLLKTEKDKDKKRVVTGPLSLIQIDKEDISLRLPEKKPNVLLKAPTYFMNNRKVFISKINSLFSKYKEELTSDEQTFSCDSGASSEFNMLTHQKIVRDYINIYTPYRGTLLFHGLGSGKSCSSIAIAEGLKEDKNIIIMTPASLRTNYIEELKKCGDELYKKNQYWEFIDANSSEIIDTLSNILKIPVSYIKEKGGAWLVDIKKEANYDKKTSGEKKLIDAQLNKMIDYKYKFINYNGLRNSHLQALSEDYQINPFDNKVIIIDEAHNFVSRIVNKITKSKKKTLSILLYEYLMGASNCKIIMLTGTPIINYPNEIAILFNILRGYIKTFDFKLVIEDKKKINLDTLTSIFKKENAIKFIDYIDYKSSTNSLIITLNPFDFISILKDDIYNGVTLEENENINDDQFIEFISNILGKYKIKLLKQNTNIEKYKCLPDDPDEFNKLFISNKNIINEQLFKKRILGLVSYYKSAQESLMPSFRKSTDLFVEECIMSDFQFGVYEEARIAERNMEKNKPKPQGKNDDLYNDSVSTYRIFSRAFCNFVFPKPYIKRPMPQKDGTIEDNIENENINEDILDALNAEQQIENTDGLYEADDITKLKQNKLELSDETYESRIQLALKELSIKKDEYLNPEALKTYSPKFLRMLENIINDDDKALHLIYSQFRTLEGIGIFKLVLEANGFAEFKLAKNEKDEYILNISDENKGKPTFVLYTGTETTEEKEIVRNIYNSNWKFVPNSIVKQIEKISTNNNYGEIIKIFMITSSGAEGISLKSTRYVHIVEPYWHPVRVEQVIGRARRICSHYDLPKELQNVKVFIYLSAFSKEQLKSDKSIELRLKDLSKIDGKTPVTSDQLLYEISNLKQSINDGILKNVKEAAFDCAIYNKADNEENLQCFNIQSNDPTEFLYSPNINDNEKDSALAKNRKEATFSASKLTIKGVNYAYDKKTGKVYDYDSYIAKNPIQVGTLSIKDGKYQFEKI